MSTLDQRLDAFDSTIGELQSADEDIDERLDAIDGGEVLTGNTLVSRVRTNEGSITNLQNAISPVATGNDPGGLTERVTALEREPKSATEVITEDYIEYDNDGNPTIYSTNAENSHIAANVIVPSPDKDYLLQKDDKYYFLDHFEIFYAAKSLSLKDIEVSIKSAFLV